MVARGADIVDSKQAAAAAVEGRSELERLDSNKDGAVDKPELLKGDGRGGEVDR